MKIYISTDLIKKIGVSKFKMLRVDEDRLNWNKKLEVNLTGLDIKEVEYLRNLILPHPSVLGVKHALWEIEIWLRSLKGGKAQSVKRLNHLTSLLYNHIKKTPHFWLFQKHGSQDSEIFVAYYVSNIKYVPEDRRRDYYHPAYVRMDVVYECFGEKKERSFSFKEPDVVGKKIEEILLKYDLFTSDEELCKIHGKEIIRYGDLITKVGHQFSVLGETTDDVPGEKKDYWNKTTIFTFSDDRRKNRVVVDEFLDVEGKEEDNHSREVEYDSSYWFEKKIKLEEDEDEEEDHIDNEIEIPSVDIPIHPFLVVFDLFRHLRLRCHVSYLKEYVYDRELASKLILPEEIKTLVTMLVNHKEGNFKDIVAGKGGGAIILLTGAPGVGKTLTAEVFAEADQKPLYSVQASQLGINAEELETNLLHVLQRAARWNAILLLDEADVYVHERGDNLTQNAIVGVFLRTLEYHASVLFLTSNRPELVDDAIASRCVARIDYKYPTKEDQKRIWKVLCESSNINIKPSEYNEFAEKHPKISGRDVKNLLKLAGLISSAQKKPITNKMLEYVLKFKPTSTEKV